ncbi:MAG: SdpI family protein [Lachnospiraceae bacterium]|nr:SdpI family protein [Lachnospiraceae bacterium]
MKLKDYKGTIILTSIIILLPILVGLYLWPQLPEQIATHFDANNQPNGYSSKEFTVFGLPLFMLFVHILCLAGTKADPKSENIHSKMINLVLWICPIVSLMMGLVTYSYALGYNIDVSSIAMALVGLMFIIVGNYLPKSKQSYTMGIKLPWTLADEGNWNRTHRMAGFLWMLCGIITIISMLLRVYWTVPVVIAVAVFVPTIYSYVHYCTHKNSKKN